MTFVLTLTAHILKVDDILALKVSISVPLELPTSCAIFNKLANPSELYFTHYHDRPHINKNQKGTLAYYVLI